MTADDLAAQLTRHRLDEGESARKRVLGQLVLDQFGQAAEGVPAAALWVPGRIEVFGKHTDYGGGHSLVAPVPRGFVFVARRRSDRIVAMTDAARGEQFTLSLENADTNLPSPSGWRRYAATAVHRLQRNFPGAVAGADIVFASDLPPSSGMSSSSALIVGLATMLVRLGGIDTQREWLAAVDSPADAAGYFACIENGLAFASLAGDAGVGTHGGSEDHVALTCGRAGHVSAWRFVPIHHVAEVAVPADWQFVIAASGVAAKKTGGARDAYNHLSSLVQSLLDLWNRHGPAAPSLRAALTSSSSAVDRLAALIREDAGSSAELERRLMHFVAEDARIPDAVQAFRDADRDRLSTLSDASQSDAEALLGNQVPETISLARSARALGAFAASAFGAGFGGSVWALVQKNDAADFSARWFSEYRSQFPAREAATVFLAPPGPPLTWLV